MGLLSRAAKAVWQKTVLGRQYAFDVGNKRFFVDVMEAGRGPVGVSFRREGKTIGEYYDPLGDATTAEALKTFREIRRILASDAHEFRPSGYGWSPSTEKQKRLYDFLISSRGMLPDGYFSNAGNYPQVSAWPEF